MQVRLSDLADRDLEEITDYIAQDNPDRAVTFAMEMQDACLGLAHHALRFPLLAGTKDLGLGQRVFGRYRILYQVDANTVVIVRILHAARDYDRILFPED